MSKQDKRPPVAVGHVTLQAPDVARTAMFFEDLGLRSIFRNDRMAIFELRGGTHLLIFKSSEKPASGEISGFDLMVDDVRKFRNHLATKGFEAGPFEKESRGGHTWFKVRIPDGRWLAVYSSHAGDRPV